MLQARGVSTLFNGRIDFSSIPDMAVRVFRYERDSKGGSSRKVGVMCRNIGPSKAEISVRIEVFDGTDAESLRSSIHAEMLEMARHSHIKLGIPKKS